MPDALCQIANSYYKKASQIEDAQRKDYFRRAAEIYEKIINVLPASRNLTPRACYFAGDCCHELGEYEKSVQYYQKVVDNYPTYGLAWSALFNIGSNYQQMSKAGLISKSEADAKTKAAYEQLLVKYPDCRAAIAAQGWLSR